MKTRQPPSVEEAIKDDSQEVYYQSVTENVHKRRNSPDRLTSTRIDLDPLTLDKQDRIERFFASRAPIIPLLVFTPPARVPSHSGIGRLPPEILTSIFGLCHSIGTPRTRLMLVCKDWHTGMQSPTLWNEIILRLPKDKTLHLVYPEKALINAVYLVDMRRRLYLSGSVPLDVVILTAETADDANLDSSSGNEDLMDYLPLETIVSHCETHRWRSLCVRHGGKYYGDALDLDTPRLESLSLQESALEFFISSGLHQSLLSINVPLLHADIPKLTQKFERRYHPTQ